MASSKNHDGEGHGRRKAHKSLPLLPLRDIVVFPYMVVPLFVGREKSIQALEQAMARDKEIVATYLFSHPGSAVVADELEKGLTKERIRQITRRAARVMADLASDNPRFAGMPGMAQENDDAPSPHIDIHPAAGQGHNRIVRIGAPDSAGDNSLPTEADETAEAEILLRYGGARH